MAAWVGGCLVLRGMGKNILTGVWDYACTPRQSVRLRPVVLSHRLALRKRWPLATRNIPMKWNWQQYPRVELALNNAGRLILQRADQNAVPANVFTENQIGSLWRTIAGSGLDAEAESVTLFDGLQENGRLKAAEASITRSTGSNRAYEAWQLAAFEPIHLELRVNHGKPQLRVQSVVRENTKPEKAKPPVLEIKRLTAEGEKPEPQGKGKSQSKIARAD